MNWKKFLIGLMSAGIIGYSSCNSFLPNQQRVKEVINFENNNSSLEDKLIAKTAQSIELVSTSANYHLKNGEKTFEKLGSSTIINEDNRFYYVLTANHVVEMPKILTFTSSSAKHLKKNKEIIKMPNNLTTDYNYILELTNTELRPTNSSTTTKTSTTVLISNTSITVAGLEAEIVCSDKKLDYALLRVPKNKKLFPLSKNKNVYLGNSKIIDTGDYVYAIGFPLGLDRFVTDGIISNTHLPKYSFWGMFRIYDYNAFMFTSPISSGNSGGPLFSVANGNLYLIGLINAKYTIGDDLNIAIKIDEIMKDLKDNGVNVEELNKKTLDNYHKTKYKK